MNPDIRQQLAPDYLQKKALEERIWVLRKQGKTYSEIGKIEGISSSKARYLFDVVSRRSGKPLLWTDGLSDRLANSLRWLGFKDREDVTEAMKSGHLRRLALFERGLRGGAMDELAQWLGLEDTDSGIDTQT
jgi:hypothetical protein